MFNNAKNVGKSPIFSDNALKMPILLENAIMTPIWPENFSLAPPLDLYCSELVTG